MATIPASGPSAAPPVRGDSIVLAEVLLDLAERAQAYTNAAGVAIALIRGKDLLVRTSTGMALEVGVTIPLSDAFIAECLRTRKPVTCRDVEADGRLGHAFRALNVRSLMAIPVCEVRDVRGMMLVFARQCNAFQPTHISILMTLSDIVAAKLREHEAVSVVEIPLFEETEPTEELPADPVSTLSIFEPEPSSLNDLRAGAPPMAGIPMPARELAVEAAAPAVTESPVPPPPTAPFPGIAVASQSAAEKPKLPLNAPEPDFFEPPSESLPQTQYMSPAAATPTAPVEPAAVPAAPVEAVHPAAAAPPVVADKPVVAPAPAKPQTRPASATVTTPLGSSPELPITPALAMMEEKIETTQRDPSLLTPSEDPRRYSRPRNFVATTVGHTVSTTAATTTPKLTVKPFAVAAPPAVTAPPAVSPPAQAAEDLPAAAAAPVFSSWEEPEPTRKIRPWMLAVCAVAALVALGVGLWIQRAASTPGPAPTPPVPAVAAVALPPAAPAPVAPAVTLTKPVAAESRTEPKPAVKETRAIEQTETPQEEPGAPVMQIATGSAEPKPEPPVAGPAPKLNLASSDTGINNLSRVSVALPVPPKSQLVPAELVSQTRPVYPALAKQLGIYGAVVLEVAINADGSVGTVRVKEGPAALRKAAIDAVRKWRYKPATLNGDPVEATATVMVKFTK